MCGSRRKGVCLLHDGGRSWPPAGEHRLDGALRNNYVGVRPLALPIGSTEGAILLPIEALDERGQSRVYFVASLDHGRSFGPAEYAVADPAAELGCGDPRLALLDDRSIVVLLWVYRRATERSLPVHRPMSVDASRSW